MKNSLRAMTKRTKNFLYSAIYVVVLVAIIFGTWAVASAVIGTEYILPDIGVTFAALGELLSGRSFYVSLGGTLLRSVIAYGLSFVLFFALFFFSVSFDGFKRVITPLMGALRTLPTMAIALVFAIWAGARLTPIILGVTVVLPQLYSAFIAHNASTSTELGEVCKICGASRAQRFAALYLPHAAGVMPEVLSSSLAFSVKIVIAAEILMQTAESIGMLMSLSQMYLHTAKLIALTFAAVVVSVALETVLRLVLRKSLDRFLTT